MIFKDQVAGVSLSNIIEGHTIKVYVWRVTGFGYCYQYNDKKEVIVAGKLAETADGVGGTELCEGPESDVSSTQGNTFVLIPLDNNDDFPRKQIHISYDYPLSGIGAAKSNLNQILSTFRFIE